VDPEPVWTGTEDLVPTGIRSPYRPARSQSTELPGPLVIINSNNKNNTNFCVLHPDGQMIGHNI
jgi:hypothetical protein